MNTTTLDNPPRSYFTRLCDTKSVKSLVKEAKAVGYSVDTKSGDDFGNGGVWGYEVRDPSHENSLVFKAIMVKQGVWGTTFSKVYWQEPN